MAHRTPETKADFSFLRGDEALADVTIQIKLKKQPDAPAEPAGAAAASAGAEGGQEQPEAKRARTDGGADASTAAAAAAAAGVGVVKTIRAHSAVLVQRSAYFRAILMGGGASMIEGRTRVITVEVKDEDEAVVFERLIRLSYSATYTEDYGWDLDKEELMALLVLGDAYEMRWCVLECAAALPPFESYDAAVAFFRVMPYGYLKDPQLEKALIDGGNVLAKALGPVQDLWSFDIDEWTCGGDDLQNEYRLDKRVASLPVAAMAALLRSSELQLTSENYAFSLAYWWSMEQEGKSSDEELQKEFSVLLMCLRYGSMSCPFLASIVHIGAVADSGLVPSIMSRAIWRREMSGDCDRDGFSVGHTLPYSRVGRNYYDTRSRYERSLTAVFSKREMDWLEEHNTRVHAPIGLVQGFPCYLSLIAQEGEKLKYSLALGSEFVGVFGPDPDDPDWEDRKLEKWRGLPFKVLRGSIGGTTLNNIRGSGFPEYGGKIAWCHVGMYDPIVDVPADVLEHACDREGKVQVELEVEIEQPRFC